MNGRFPHVAIRSAGCVSPLGIGLAETLAGLRESRDGIAPVRLFSVAGCHSGTAGQVDARLSAVATGIDQSAANQSRAAQMVLAAMAEALEGAPGFQPDAVIVGTTSGGMSLGEEFFRAVLSGRPAWPEALRVRDYAPQRPVAEAMRILRLSAGVRVVSNACASGTNALGLAGRMIATGRARRVLAGGYDALAELVFAGFDCLRASTAEKCRPFDAARSGLALGEGAAFFCLERGSDGPRISGYGSTTDTHHLTQPHPSGSGPRSAMERALASAGADASSIDYINAHGTGTPLNDASEARAIQSVCPQAAVSSTKGMTGHALGAAGAIEAAFCLLALREGFLPANINFSRTEPDVQLDIVANAVRPKRPTRLLSNSFGFGGANATIVMEQ